MQVDNRAPNPGIPEWAALLVGLLGTALPRLLTGAGPTYPDAALYEYAVTVNPEHGHLVFRYVSLIPVWIGALFGADPFVMARISGLVTGALGVAAVYLLCRALEVDRNALLAALLLYAAGVEGIVYAGWVPLTDHAFALATIVTMAAYLGWEKKGWHPAWAGLAAGALLGTRVLAVFVVLALLSLRPWKKRTTRDAGVLFAWMGGFAVAYLSVSGLVVAGNPLWFIEALTELLGVHSGPATNTTNRNLTHLALMMGDPRGLAVAALWFWSLTRGERFGRFVPLLVCSLWLVVGLDLFSAALETINPRLRRLEPIYLLSLPLVAVFLVRALRPLGGICVAALSLTAACLAAGVANSLPHFANHSLGKWCAVLIILFLLAAVVRKSSLVIAAAIAVVLVVGTYHEVLFRKGFQQNQLRRLQRLRTAEGVCPTALVRPGIPLDEALGRLNRLLNGACADTVTAGEPAAAMEAPVVFSRLKKIDGYRSETIHGAWKIRRFDRAPAPAENEVEGRR